MCSAGSAGTGIIGSTISATDARECLRFRGLWRLWWVLHLPRRPGLPGRRPVRCMRLARLHWRHVWRMQQSHGAVEPHEGYLCLKAADEDDEKVKYVTFSAQPIADEEDSSPLPKLTRGL